MEDNIVHRISSFFHPTAPHFFKIILQQTIRTGKLVVPKKFVRKYGKDLSLSNAVILKVPNGDAWEVELRKGASDVWLQKGWLDFANFYSIKHGYFLVFKYEPGSSNGFDVVVFDKSATEIEYPMKSKVTLSSIKVESINEDDDISAEKWNPQPSSGTKRSWTNTCPWEYIGALEREEKLKALKRAKSFESSSPYLPVVMQPSYVHPSYKLSLPGRMLQSYLGQHKSGKMELLVSGDKNGPCHIIFQHM
ncbi:B3 domain-containing protein At3g18960-like [Punica granatum]|uniref:B3 domain-containing protein At3g18960-like n=1 Tax=Punica granatum TaxID=22663 RepID=A0A6P8DC17_PUNGR|nr:B3 domain-containing protein At3g18960-like [Punica granatum]